MVDREEVKNRRTEGGRRWKTVQSGIQELERNVRKNICNKFNIILESWYCYRKM